MTLSLTMHARWHAAHQQRQWSMVSLRLCMQMSAARVAGHINSCLRKAEVAAERAAKQRRAAEEAEAARFGRQHACLSYMRLSWITCQRDGLMMHSITLLTCILCRCMSDTLRMYDGLTSLKLAACCAAASSHSAGAAAWLQPEPRTRRPTRPPGQRPWRMPSAWLLKSRQSLPTTPQLSRLQQ